MGGRADICVCSVYGRKLVAPAELLFVHFRLSLSILPSISVYPMHGDMPKNIAYKISRYIAAALQVRPPSLIRRLSPSSCISVKTAVVQEDGRPSGIMKGGARATLDHVPA